MTYNLDTIASKASMSLIYPKKGRKLWSGVRKNSIIASILLKPTSQKG